MYPYLSEYVNGNPPALALPCAHLLCSALIHVCVLPGDRHDRPSRQQYGRSSRGSMVLVAVFPAAVNTNQP
jgi:hypothetical protein